MDPLCTSRRAMINVIQWVWYGVVRYGMICYDIIACGMYRSAFCGAPPMLTSLHQCGGGVGLDRTISICSTSISASSSSMSSSSSSRSSTSGSSGSSASCGSSASSPSSLR